MKEKVKQVLNSIEGKVWIKDYLKISLCLDTWSDSSLQSYMGITATYIFDNQLVSILLSLCPVVKTNSLTLCSVITDTLEEFEIQNKLFSITSDNGKSLYL